MRAKPVLVIMSAGIGSRYGAGIKQLAHVGPAGELLIDYSIFDAKRAGFEKVIFIIRKDIEDDFHKIIGDRARDVMDVEYAFQETDDLPRGFTCPEGRTKPWGTGHAVLAAADLIKEPFAVINADDYYGAESFKLIYDFLVKEGGRQGQKLHFAMPGFILGNTLSDNGEVTRGVCRVDANGGLTGIQETSHVRRCQDRKIRGVFNGKERVLDERSPVSMNFWAFTPEFLWHLKVGFKEFLADSKKDSLKAEYLLPVIVDGMLKKGLADVSVLPTSDRWFGLTYRQDKDIVAAEFVRLTQEGIYPMPLNAN